MKKKIFKGSVAAKRATVRGGNHAKSKKPSKADRKIVKIPPLSEDQREYLKALDKPEVDLTTVIGDPQ